MHIPDYSYAQPHLLKGLHAVGKYTIAKEILGRAESWR
jgi:hypothetical protein